MNQVTRCLYLWGVFKKKKKKKKKKIFKWTNNLQILLKLD